MMSRSAVKISVFGLGYVGCVSAACLANEGHDVVGVDVSAEKVDALRMGHSPIVEPGLAAMIASAVSAGRLRASVDAAEAIRESELSLVCVGTPSTDGGAPDLGFVSRVCEQIGTSLRHRTGRHTVVLRSTMLPGSSEQIVIPILEHASRRLAGRDFGVCYHPEFLREGTAVQDFFAPARVVIGQLDAVSGDGLQQLYTSLVAPLVRTDLRTAEMVKYTDNAFHALKISFANEIGNLCKALGIDSHRVMDIFVLDTRLNLAPTYLTPGFAFGGACLPKDLRALIQRARELNVDGPLLRAALASNEQQKRLGFELIRRMGRRKIGVLGLSFKHDTDDLRESPAVELVEMLLGERYSVAVYDRNVSLSALVGSNRAYIERHLPHLATLMCSTLDEVLAHADVLVITNRDREFASLCDRLRPDQLVIDFVRIREDCAGWGERYQGICW